MTNGSMSKRVVRMPMLVLRTTMTGLRPINIIAKSKPNLVLEVVLVAKFLHQAPRGGNLRKIRNPQTPNDEAHKTRCAV